MKLLFKRISSVLLFLCLFKGAFGQDFHLSQYDAAPLYLNPSMTGMFDGYYRIHGHYRTQWKAAATKPFVTTGLSFEMPIKKFSVGAQVLNNRAGAGSFNIFSFLLSGAYDLPIDAKKFHRVSLGVQGGVFQTSVKQSNLTFENQFVPSPDGGMFNTNIDSKETTLNSSRLSPDINAGLMYYYANKKSMLDPFIGFSAQHLISPNQSLLDGSSKLPLRLNLHGGVKINLTEDIQVLPKFLYMKQGNAKELTMSIIGYYYAKPLNVFLMFGPTYRNKDASIFEVGLKYGHYTYLLSYDINTSSLTPSTNGKGGFEFSVTYVPKKSKASVPTCPRL